MKKYLIPILTLSLVMLAAGCGQTKTPAASEKPAAQTSAQVSAEPSAQASSPKASAKAPKQAAMQEVALSDQLKNLKLPGVNGAPYLALLDADAKSYLIEEGAIPQGLSFGSSVGLYSYDPVSKQQNELVNLQAAKLRVWSGVREGDQLYFTALKQDGGGYALFSVEGGKPKEIKALGTSYDLGTPPMLFRTKDGIYLYDKALAPEGSAASGAAGKLTISRLEKGALSTVYEQPFGEGTAYGQPGFAPDVSSGELVFTSYLSDKQESLIHVLRGGKVEDIKVPGHVQEASLSGDTLLLMRPAVNQKDGSDTQKIFTCDLKTKKTGEEIDSNLSLSAISSLGGGSFLVIAQQAKDTYEAAVLTTQGGTPKLAQSLGKLPSSGVVVRTGEESAVIACQDYKLDSSVNHIFRVDLQSK